MQIKKKYKLTLITKCTKTRYGRRKMLDKLLLEAFLRKQF
jgi:hypothetical protein